MDRKKERGRPAHIDPAWLERRASRPPSFNKPWTAKRSVGDPPTLILRGYKGGRVALPPLKNHGPRKECGRPAHIDPAWLQRRASRPPSFNKPWTAKRSVGDPPTLILRGYKGRRVALPPLKTMDRERSVGDPPTAILRGGKGGRVTPPSPGLALANKNSSCPLRFFLVRAARLQIHHQNTNICWIHATDTIGLTQRARHNFDQLLRALSPQSFD